MPTPRVWVLAMVAYVLGALMPGPATPHGFFAHADTPSTTPVPQAAPIPAPTFTPALPTSGAPVCGPASWYGGGERLGRLTASGERFDPAQLTCASWDYPLGTRVQVTNLASGRTICVRVNDRGPAQRLHRLIDLSRAAFAQLAALDDGVIRVELRPVMTPPSECLEGVPHDSWSAWKLVTPPAPTSN